MVAVVDDRGETAGARYIEFKVYPSPEEPNRAQASWRFPDAGMAIEQSQPGSALEMEFRHAVDCADRHAIPFV